MPPVPKRRTGRRVYNGFEVNLYGFLPDHLIKRDQQASQPGLADFWDPGNTRLESMGSPGDTTYTIIVSDTPRPGTVAVFSGPQALADDGKGKILDGSGVERGTINYTTGRVQIEFVSPAVYDVYVTYATGPEVDTASYWDEDEKIWDRVANQPVIQKTFWAIELDATDLANRVDDYRDLSYVDEISPENAQYAFEGYGFDGQIVGIDTELSRAWLRSMSTQWQLKCSLRIWRRVLQNLGFSAKVFELYKTHPLDNYGLNPGEIYSRVFSAIGLEQQEIYERALEVAGFDPTQVPLPATGASVTRLVGVGSSSTIMGVQIPVITDAPDWNSITFELSSLSGGVDPEDLTLDPNTGDVTGSAGAFGRIDLFSGTGQIDFGRVLEPEYSLSVTYNTLGTPYQAARVDVEIDLDESVPYKSGDRAAKAVIRALDFFRPIHVLIRVLGLGFSEEEIAGISESSCCGPNIADIVSYSYPTGSSSEPAVNQDSPTLFGGSVGTPPIIPGSFKIIDLISAQVIEDNGFGDLVGDGNGQVNYALGIFWAEFNAAPGGVPTVAYSHYIVTSSDAVPETIRYVADSFDMGESKGDRSFSEIGVTYTSEDIDSDYSVLAPDFVAGTNYAGNLQVGLVPGEVVIKDHDTGQEITDDGAGNLIGDVDGGGTNTVDYVTGNYDVDFSSAPTDPVAVFQFNSLSAHLPGQEDLYIVFEDNAKIEGDYVAISLESTGYSEPIGVSGSAAYSGFLAELGQIPGSVTFREDPGSAQQLSDTVPESQLSGDGTGTLQYATGDLSVVFGAPTVGDPVVKYTVINVEGYEEQLETTIGVAGTTVYNAILTGGQIVPGSVIVEDEDSGQTLQDDGIVALLGNGSGTINYVTGEYVLNFTIPTVDDVIVEFDQVLVSVF